MHVAINGREMGFVHGVLAFSTSCRIARQMTNARGESWHAGANL
ncbi:MAG: hypothetical protein ACXWJ0_02090 [Xanthobacteraceae bacterium]